MPEIGSRKPPGRVLAVIEGCRGRLRQLIGRFTARDVDDILQEAFMRSFEGAGKGSLRNPRAFLLRTANLAFNHVARTKLSAHKEDLTLPEVCQLTLAAPESQVQAQQRFVTLCRAVGSLPEECRRAFILKKVYGLSQTEIADRLAVPRSLVERYIATGLMLCREYIETASRPADPDARSTGNGHRP